MKSNLHGIDRMLRLVVGALLVALAVMGVIGAWGYVGAVFVLTAFMNFCPIYRMFNFSTKKKG